MGLKASVVLVQWLVLVALAYSNVSYDGRALIVNGTRKMLFSGSIHYPRSTPKMWPSLISHAKDGGIDVIQTYVFWNVHEPFQGQYNFQGRNNLVNFIKEIKKHGLYASLRIGPFIEGEWKYGGIPFWLHDVPGIVFRTDNEPFKFHMQKFVTMIVNMMKSERLYASQGGPIIISQIENEYQTIEPLFLEKGPAYVHWAASMAVGLQTGVPWMMCKQYDAPNPVINTCNGVRCGETFSGPNSPNKPSLWTENWTSRFPVYGEEPQTRSAEEIAFSVALFIAAKQGTFVNYYMYHGGTNFGNSAASYVTTSYYDEAPIDEYGLIRQPTWGHLKELHAATKLTSEPLLWGTYSNISLGKLQNAHIFQMNSEKCAAFLINSEKFNRTVHFWSNEYILPAKSISILPDCKKEVFNTAKVNAQYGVRSTTTVQNLSHAESWTAFSDGVSNFASASFTNNSLLEQMTTTKDATDYLWYTISYNHWSGENQYVLHVNTRAHVVHAFVNGAFVGSVHGHHGKAENVYLETLISLKNGQNNISLLSVMVGLPDSGAHMERQIAGLRYVRLRDMRNQTQDLTSYLWGYQVGLVGEKFKIFAQNGSNNVNWTSIGSTFYQPLTWFKTTFDAPPGADPVAINLGSMAKGEVWVNAESIGRYWVSFKTPEGRPSQSLYHIPRSFLKRWGNLLVIFEEIGGNPLQITIETISVPRVCSNISESHLPTLISQRRSHRQHRQRNPSAQLLCNKGRTITFIEFASYGNPFGDCQNYAIGNCHSNASKVVVEKACLGRRACSIPVSPVKFGGDPCPGISKSLLVVARCS